MFNILFSTGKALGDQYVIVHHGLEHFFLIPLPAIASAVALSLICGLFSQIFHYSFSASHGNLTKHISLSILNTLDKAV